MLLTRNKSKEWREQILKRANVLVSFLNENDLLIDIIPFDNNNNVREDLVIKNQTSQVTDLNYLKKTIPGGAQFLDKGGKIENISRLEKGLIKIREIK